MAKKQRPWDKLGISKSTYYRKKRAGKVLGLPTNEVPDDNLTRQGRREAWVQVGPQAVANGANPFYDDRKAYAEEMVERALVESFISDVMASCELRGANGRFFQINMRVARAVSNYAAYSLIKKDAERERREEERAEKARADVLTAATQVLAAAQTGNAAKPQKRK